MDGINFARTSEALERFDTALPGLLYRARDEATMQEALEALQAIDDLAAAVGAAFAEDAQGFYPASMCRSARPGQVGDPTYLRLLIARWRRLHVAPKAEQMTLPF